ncbi:HlyD family secretion protein [Chondromyces crocatus]|uniref:Membrane fusion protein biotin-lipoyl like domain-containing protein n=1 Tax=Chondromyces crocatus TaxID=52 RepID=A0A0K1EJV1_CHOCO|nr:HlyD family efflux transporter periplasmic adaptor subunit [Chondromyces crocatus]AKT41124.1 uncharacterized protein CMC5_052850 [Chondromyces crocatus]
MKMPYRFRGALQDAAPWLCLVSTLGLAAYLHVGGDARGHIVGFEQPTLEALAPTEIARVASIQVTLNEEVAPGQIVATLDSSLVDAEIAVARATVRQLEAQSEADQFLLEADRTASLEELQRELARQREEQLQAAAGAKALDEQLTRVRQLVQDRVAVLEDLNRLDVQHATVQALATEKPRTIGLLSRQIQAAEQRKHDAQEPPRVVAERLEADLSVARRNVELLEQRRAALTLRATHGGRVAGIDKQVGNVVAPGEPVVRVVDVRGSVVACVPERSAFGIVEGDTARLWIRGQNSAPLTGKVTALGPLVAELPIRCWPNPKTPLWGREISITMDNPMSLLAGQSFDIVFKSSHGGQVAMAAAPQGSSPPPLARTIQGALPASSTGGATLMTVPPALTTRSRFEPSGVLARPGEGRYLVISDDTGFDDGENDSAPWLFAMSAAGVVDPTPLVVEGVDQLVDVEAITAGDDGAIYLLSSQSYSRKGKRKRARTALLRLRAEGQGFRVDGEVHLAEMLDASPDRASQLGLPAGTRELDLEGLGFHKGALYVGLKAPLDARGNAMIWKIGDPKALFEGATKLASTAPAPEKGKGKGNGKGKDSKAPVDPRLLDAGAVSLWANARVDVDLAGKPTPGGISDLQFMPDGSLAITSTPSTADGDAGALWRVDSPQAGALTPRLVQRFPGLKPEGVAPSLSPGKVMIVFDTGARPPSYQELPWVR